MQLLHQQPSRPRDVSEYWNGARLALPIAAVIGAIGILFGYMATTAGLTPLAAIVMSGTTFAGSAQFAAITVLASGGSVYTAVGSSLLMNARFVPMGMAISPAFRGSIWKRLLFAQLVVDEAWGIAYLGEGRFSKERLAGSGLVLYVTHICSTGLGAVLGKTLGNPAEWGLDAAFPALFVILLWPHLRNASRIVAALLAATIALTLTPVTSPGIPILAAAVAAFVGGQRL